MADESVPEFLTNSPPTKTAEAPREAPEKNRRLGDARGRYYQAREDARRYNRNLLQYAGAIAAVIGIGSGSGGIIAVANALNTDGDAIVSGVNVLYVLLAAGSLALLLAFPLGWASWQRGRAEGRKDDQLIKLMVIDPDFNPPQE